MWQKLLNNIILLAIFSTFIFCTSHIKEDKLTRDVLPLIDKIFENKISKGVILILSEYDCESCSENTFSKINSIVENTKDFQLYGIYFTIRKKRNIQYNEFVKNTQNQILWKNTTNMELFGKVSQNSDKQHSPFIVKIENKKVMSITSISKR